MTITLNPDYTFHAILGAPGTGKSYFINEQSKNNPKWALKTSTTGISAVNIGCKTLHSTLGFYDTNSLIGLINSGDIFPTLEGIASHYEYLIIDEISMLEGMALDLIAGAIKIINKKNTLGRTLKLLVVGDPAQLPYVSTNVKSVPFFQAKLWPEFEVHYLTEIKRQSDSDFIKVLHNIRLGEVNDEDIKWIKNNIGFHHEIDPKFKGLTFLGTNNIVDNYNYEKLSSIPQPPIILKNIREGRESSEWKHIPEQLTIKIGAKIILISNSYGQGNYVNGDLGIVQDYLEETQQVLVKVARTNRVEVIERITRDNIKVGSKKILGKITYYPFKLGYYITVHRSQGLTLDSAQVRIFDLARYSGALLVAMSRVPDYHNLRVVGGADAFKNCCKIDKKYKNFLLQLEQTYA